MAFPLALKLFDLDMFGSVPFDFDQHCKIFDFMMPIWPRQVCHLRKISTLYAACVPNSITDLFYRKCSNYGWGGWLDIAQKLSNEFISEFGKSRRYSELSRPLRLHMRPMAGSTRRFDLWWVAEIIKEEYEAFPPSNLLQCSPARLADHLSELIGSCLPAIEPSAAGFCRPIFELLLKLYDW